MTARRTAGYSLPVPIVHRDIPSLSVRAAIEPSSIDREARTVDVMWSTGARVRRGFWEPFDEELSMDPKHVRMERLSSGKAPVLDGHNRTGGTDAVRGVVVSASIANGKGIAKLRFAKAEHDPEAERMFGKICDGIIGGVSVGYRVHKMILVEAGDRQAGTVPVYRAIDWEPNEISPCDIGAEAGAGFRSEASQTTNRCEFVTRTEDPEMTTPTVAPVVVPAPVADPARAAPVVVPAPVVVDQAASEARGAELELARSTGIRSIVRKAKLPETVADGMIEKKITLDAARAQVLDQLAAGDDTNPINGQNRSDVTIGDDDSDKFKRQAQSWLIERAGLSDLFERAGKVDKKHVLVLDSGNFRGSTLKDMARKSLALRGFKHEGIDQLRMVGDALTKRWGGQSTSDFAIIMEDSLNKIVLAAYATAEDRWREFCAVGSVPDFKAAPRYRLGGLGRLDPVGEGGEFKHKDLADATKQTVQASTVGNIIALTRQAIINDDMGAFSKIAVQLGRAAKLSVELDVFELLAENGGLGPLMSDGLALFDAGHANIGTPAVLSVASVDADSALMASHIDGNGEVLDFVPRVLLVPRGLKGLANVINGSQFDPTANAAQGRPNIVVGTYAKVIDTARLTGTRRYSFADPSIAPVFEVVFLDGKQEPFLDQEEGFDVDGTKWKVRLDYGVAAVDHYGAVTNAGV